MILIIVVAVAVVVIAAKQEEEVLAVGAPLPTTLGLNHVKTTSNLLGIL